jgi:RsmE family RNA methyltransferase
VNSLILLPQEVEGGGRAVVRSERAKYLTEFHDLPQGRKLAIGILGGKRGRGEVVSSSPEEYVFQFTLEEDPPKQKPIRLIVAAPRPQILKRVILGATQLGVSSITFVNSERGEKSYLQSNFFKEELLQTEIIKALEQGSDTMAPAIKKEYSLHKCLAEHSYKPSLRIIAEMSGRQISAISSDISKHQEVLIAVGSEAGWSESETALFKEEGFIPVTLGERVLRVDIAVIALAAQVLVFAGAAG